MRLGRLQLDMSRPRPYPVLVLGLVGISFAATFTRLAQGTGMPSLVVAALRLSTACLLLLPLALSQYRANLATLTRREWVLCVASGVLLGVHFATGITSLEYTSVIANNVLSSTSPLFVAVLSVPLLRERVRREVVIGILVAFVGSVVIARSGSTGLAPDPTRPLYGTLLAILSAVNLALYVMIGRRVRQKLPLIVYIWLVYSFAALALLAAVFFAGQSVFQQQPIAYLWVVLLGILPQLIGHSSFNYAVGHLPAARVSSVHMAGPIGNIIMAMIILGEVPAPVAVIGAVIVSAGVIYANRTRAIAQTPDET